MGKKSKSGKNRLDKYYHLAKDSGYRSRAAFKLIQLNKKFDFLSKAKVLIDLCAAPGSWLQVAHKFMPSDRVIVGVDLDTIKPITNVIAIQADITTPKCLSSITHALNGKQADIVLHDGAPNVGGTWSKDAYGQSELTLSALKLATKFLKYGGWLVTKVFRSADYNSLLWVFQHLFKKVTSTKPNASRNTSAEIYVICEGYLAPDTISAKMLDPRSVFKDINEVKPVNIFAKKVKVNREGYNTDSMLLFKRCSVVEFIESDDPVTYLAEYNEILFRPVKPEEDAEEISIFEKHPSTTDEIKICLQDLKVLNPKDFKKILRWRMEMRKFGQLEKVYVERPKEPEDPLDNPNLTLEEKQKLLQNMVDDKIEQRDRRKIKKERKKRKKVQKLMAMVGIKSGIENEWEAPTGTEYFSLRSVKGDALNAITENTDGLMGEADFLLAPVMEEKREREDEDIFIDGKDELGDKDDVMVSKYLDLLYDNYVTKNKEYRQKLSKKGYREKTKKDTLPEDLTDFSKFESTFNEDMDEEVDEDQNDNILMLGPDAKEMSASQKASMWFSEDLFANVEEDITVEQDKKRKRDSEEALPNAKRQKLSNEPDEENLELDDVNAPFQEVAQVDEHFSDYDSDDAAEMLAMGKLLKNPVHRAEAVDNSFNRFMFDDTGANLPRWFAEEEQNHNKPIPPVTKEEVMIYKQQLKAIDSKPTYKVAEALARKKKHYEQRLTKARAKAKIISENSELNQREKVKQIQKLYRGKLKNTKQNKVYVVAKKHNNRRVPSSNVRTKLVDHRLKKDKRGKKVADSKVRRAQKQKNKKKTKKS